MRGKRDWTPWLKPSEIMLRDYLQADVIVLSRKLRTARKQLELLARRAQTRSTRTPTPREGAA